MASLLSDKFVNQSSLNYENITVLDDKISSRTASTTHNSNTFAPLSYREKIPVVAMKEILAHLLQEKLADFGNYDSEKCGEAVKWISDQAKFRLKALGYDRYKFVVQVVIGERREQGVRMASRCFWDSGTDNQASEKFTNDHIFCVASCFAVYLY